MRGIQAWAFKVPQVVESHTAQMPSNANPAGFSSLSNALRSEPQPMQMKLRLVLGLGFSVQSKLPVVCLFSNRVVVGGGIS